jgi:hypothetical protein
MFPQHTLLSVTRSVLCALACIVCACVSPASPSDPLRDRTSQKTAGPCCAEAAKDGVESDRLTPQANATDASEVAAAPPASTATEEAHEEVLRFVRRCLERRRMPARGVHNTPLSWSRAIITKPSELRARGDRGAVASLSDDHRNVVVPESPAFDTTMPHGISLTVNLKTGECIFPKYYR